MTDISEKTGLKWHNLNVGLKVSINSGMALILFLMAFFLLLICVNFFPPVEKNFVAAGALLVGAFGGYLKKRDSNNKIAAEAAKAGVGGNLNAIKMAAAGIPAAEPPDLPEEKKT